MIFYGIDNQRLNKMANYLRIIRGFSPSVRFYILANAAIGFAYFGIANVIYNPGINLRIHPL